MPELHPVPVVSPWYHLGIDFVGPFHTLSKQGNRYILTIADYLYKRFRVEPEACYIPEALWTINMCIDSDYVMRFIFSYMFYSYL